MRTRAMATPLAFAAILSLASVGPVAAGNTSVTTPLLSALAYAPLDVESLRFEFTDWAALKALHGGTQVTSGSPIEDRQALLLDISHAEASPLPWGFDRTLRSDSWGWDSTDLEWEASLDGHVTVLRLRDDWDPAVLLASLEEGGWTRRDHRYGSTYGIDPAQMSKEHRSDESMWWVTISSDERTLVLGSSDEGRQVLRRAARADPDEVAASPSGRVATALDRTLAAVIRDGASGCSGTGAEHALLSDDAATLVEAIGPLGSYQALGAGYERAGAGEPAEGRYVFAYRRRAQAEADLAGRRRLVEEGVSTYGIPYREVSFMLTDARVAHRQLILEVAPVLDRPGHLFDQLPARLSLIAVCG